MDKKYIIFNHWSPDTLYFVKNIPQNSWIWDSDWIIEDVTDKHGQCMVSNNDEDIRVWEHPESLEEINRKLYSIAKKYFDENPNENEFEEEDYLFGGTITKGMVNKGIDNFNIYSNWINNTYVDGDSSSQYQLINIDTEDFIEYGESSFAENDLNESVRIEEYMSKVEKEDPYTKDELFKDLDDFTDGFSIEESAVKFGYEKEKDLAIEILSEQGYKCFDTKVGDWFIVEFYKFLNEGYSKYGHSWVERDGMIYIYSDGKKIGEFPDKDSAFEAGYDLDNLREARDPFDHHDSEYSEEEAAATIAYEVDKARDSRYDEENIVRESLDAAREKAQELRKNSDADVILYAYRDKKGNFVDLEPEELTDEEYKARREEIKNSFTKLSGVDPRGNRYGKEHDIEFYALYNNKMMNENILKWDMGSDKSKLTPEEMDLLEQLAQKLEVNSPNGYKYVTQHTYEDYGSGMAWETIVCYNKSGHSWQVLSTKDWLDLMNTGDVDKVYDQVISDKYFQDKPKAIHEMNMWEMFESIKED